MDNEAKSFLAGALLAMLITTFVFVLLAFMPMTEHISDLQNQAIKRGYAEYRLPDGADPNKPNQTVFTWK